MQRRSRVGSEYGPLDQAIRLRVLFDICACVYEWRPHSPSLFLPFPHATLSNIPLTSCPVGVPGGRRLKSSSRRRRPTPSPTWRRWPRESDDPESGLISQVVFYTYICTEDRLRMIESKPFSKNNFYIWNMRNNVVSPILYGETNSFDILHIISSRHTQSGWKCD